MVELIEVDVLDLKAGDRVHGKNADWPQPFTNEETFVFEVEYAERINADTVHIAIAGYGDLPAAISCEPGDKVQVERR